MSATSNARSETGPRCALPDALEPVGTVRKAEHERRKTMKRAKSIAALLSMIAFYLMPPAARAAEIVMGHPSTPYGDALLSVIKAALDDRFGVKARIMPSSSPVNFKAMDANRG